MSKMPFRQVHLDFHTSPLIPDVGTEFDPEAFTERLKKSRVNSVTVFARCHHGYSYYPTKVGTKHPSLERDLLGEMIEACHRAGIQTPVYTTVVWDELAAENHDWRQVDRSGKLVGRPPLGSHDVSTEETAWRWLCMNSPYVDYLEKHVREVITNYDADGLFLDIVFQTRPGCVCSHCLKSMKEKKLNPESDEDLLQHSLLIERNFMERMTKLIHSLKPGLPVFYNGRIRLDADIKQGIKPELKNFSHLEIESLPSGVWGYNHFPLYAAYYKAMDKEIVGMTGKFHKMWGDFGSLKNQAALEYECFSMIANGAKCSIGDQLHPRGALDKSTYELIGKVYQKIEEKEPWCENAESVEEIGVLTSMNSNGAANQPSSQSDEGALRILLEIQQPFRFLDEESDFSGLRLIIVPDFVTFTENLSRKIKKFIGNGGSLLLTHQSGLNENSDFAIDIGIAYQGDLPYSPDFVKFTPDFLADQPGEPYVVYDKGSKVTLKGEGETVRGKVYDPYFNRTWDHYMSHFHTPLDRESIYPAAVEKGKIIYLSHPFFQAYRVHGNQYYKEIIKQCIHHLLPEPIIKSALPSTVQLSIMEQTAQNRRIVHLIHYIHQRRAEGLDIIEDVIPLYDVEIKLKGEKPGRVYSAPHFHDLSFDHTGNYITIKVPKVAGHEMIIIE